jgi:EAL domain-containing protein (putative c-di-GMP-specific phosphodiesterase class I)
MRRLFRLKTMGTQASQFDPSKSAQIAAKLEALCSGMMVVPAYQPIVSMQSGDVIAFEALARPMKESGFSNPGELFDAAEALGKLWELELVTRRVALQGAADFPEGTLLFFNSSPQVLGDPRFIEQLQSELAESGLSPARLVLEITERSDEAQGARLDGQVAKLKALGFRVAIDDVGAGTSGLNRMMALRPQWLKLDRDLIEGIDRDRMKVNLIKFFVHFAHLSGVRMIAEGIETQEELSTLLSLGVAFGQGYYLGKPQPAYQVLNPETVELMRSRWIDGLVNRGGIERAEVLGSLVQPARTVQACTPLLEIASEMLAHANLAGVVVVDGRRFVGWSPRTLILDRGASSERGVTIGHAVLPGVAALSPNSTIADALELASVREDAEFGTPLVVAEGDTIVGIVTMRSLVSAAASQARAGWGHQSSTPETLPGRVPAELRMRDLINSYASEGPRAPANHIDAAIIDIRQFSDVNGVFGYETGDKLIAALSEQLALHVMRPEPFGFIAHLDGDRFFVTGRTGEFDGLLERLCKGFASVSQTLIGECSPVGPAPGGMARAPGLRVLVMPQVFTRCSSPGDVFRLEKQLRQSARGRESGLTVNESLIVRDERDAQPIAGVLRRSA